MSEILFYHLENQPLERVPHRVAVAARAHRVEAGDLLALERQRHTVDLDVRGRLARRERRHADDHPLARIELALVLVGALADLALHPARADALDEAAQRTVRSWRFIAAKRGDVAVQSWVLVPIIFKLEQ